MENLDLGGAFEDANIRQDYEGLVKFDCNYSDEEYNAMSETRKGGIYTKGDVVCIRPKASVQLPVEQGGRPWGRREVVDFLVVTFKNLTPAEAKALIEPVTVDMEEALNDTDAAGRPMNTLNTANEMASRRRFKVDIDKALQEDAPAVLQDKERLARLYRRDGYEDVEQPLQNNGICGLKHVEDIKHRPDVKQRRILIKQRMLKETPKGKVINDWRFNERHDESRGMTVEGIKGRHNGPHLEQV
jgi:hypothetical protein